MSLYQPYYYPYFSARADLPRSYLQLNQKLLHIQQQQKYRNLLQKQTYLRNSQHLKRPQLHELNPNLFLQPQFQRSIREKAVLDELQLLNGLKRKQQQQRESAYLNNINRMRKQRQLIDNINRSRQSYSLNYQPEYICDDQLIRIYQSGIKKQQIQRQLAQRRVSLPIQNNIPAVHTVKNERVKVNQNNAIMGNVERNGKRQALEKRSYIQDLSESQNFDRSSPKKDAKGKTVDFIRNIQSPFKIKNTINTKKRAFSKKPIKIINQTLNKTIKKQQKLRNQSISYACPQGITSQAMHKINNRIKLSQIVYKDSKIRTTQHEMNHLLNTYYIELKGRKQIKNKINNHPDVLKNHHLVAQSR